MKCEVDEKLVDIEVVGFYATYILLLVMFVCWTIFLGSKKH